VDKTIADLLPALESGDTLIDGGNSYYIDDIRRSKELARKGIHYVDVGTSGFGSCQDASRVHCLCQSQSRQCDRDHTAIDSFGQVWFS
jgi:6-phosphogluconate dehydrogenase (decarboxylating)